MVKKYILKALAIVTVIAAISVPGKSFAQSFNNQEVIVQINRAFISQVEPSSGAQVLSALATGSRILVYPATGYASPSQYNVQLGDSVTASGVTLDPACASLLASAASAGSILRATATNPVSKYNHISIKIPLATGSLSNMNTNLKHISITSSRPATCSAVYF